jgi:hypothetical protein
MKKIIYTRFLLVALAIGSMFNAAFSQVVGEFRSAATGTWATAATWETYDGTIWAAAISPPSGATPVTILAAHNVTVGAAFTLTNPLAIFGTLTKGSFAITITGGSLAFKNGSFYIHTGTGVAIPTSTWETGSTCKITGATSTTAINAAQTFHHFIWDCAGQTGNLNLGSTDTNINGDFTVNNTGTAIIRFSSTAAGATRTATIKGNINVIKTGSNTPKLETSGSTTLSPIGNYVVNLDGNLNIDGGSVGLTGSNVINATWTIKGDINMATTTGTLLTKNASAAGSIILAKSGTQTLTNTTSGLITNAVSLTVNNGTTLSIGPLSLFDGTGAFTVSSGATLKIGSADGITSSGATGNVRSTTRTFNTAANYEYNGSAAQVTGTGLPATVNNLTINNATGVTLSATSTATGALTLTAGNLTLGANNLTVGSTVGGSSSSHVVTNAAGKMIQTGAALMTFPVGIDAASYDPVELTPSGSATFEVTVDNAIANSATLVDATKVFSREWNIARTLGSGAVTVSLTGGGGANSCDVAMPMVLGHDLGGTWEQLPATNVGNKVTGTVSAFSPFVIANLQSVLTAELTDFTAKNNGTTNVLNWSTASERNNAAFDIQRSNNGTDFTTISNVKGRGTTTSVSDYTFTDNAPSNGINYYRLRAVDRDGKATLSKNVAVINGSSKSGIVKVYPTVADAVLTVEMISDGSTTLKIMDIMGKTVLTKTLTATGFSSNPIDVSGLTNGLYILSFESATTRNTQKFIKN